MNFSNLIISEPIPNECIDPGQEYMSKSQYDQDTIDQSNYFQNQSNYFTNFDLNAELNKDTTGTLEEKRIRRLVRNREAAKRNRLKKKEWIASLLSSNSKVGEINFKLKDQICKLEKELLSLQDALYQQGYDENCIPHA